MENTFSYWMRSNLKDAFCGLITQDIDFVMIDKNKLFFIEEKNSKKARVGPAQKILFKMFDDFFENDINGYKFLGTHIIVIEKKIEYNELLKAIKESLNHRPKHDIDDHILNILWDCKGQPQIKKTEKERSGYRGSIIKEIFNNAKFASSPLAKYIENINWIFLNYCTGYFILIEEKTDGKKDLSDTRKYFIKIIDDLFTAASNKNEYNKTAKNPKSGAVYKYLGYYKLVFSNTNPDNSDRIFLNDTEIDKRQLISMFNLDYTTSIEKLRIRW